MEDVGFLSQCTRLCTVDVSGTNTVSIEALAHCQQLLRFTARYLDVDLSMQPLSNCPVLEHVDVSDSEITNLAPLEACTKLTDIYFEHAAVATLPDLSLLIELKRVRWDCSALSPEDRAQLENLEFTARTTALAGRSTTLWDAACTDDLTAIDHVLEGGTRVNCRAGPLFAATNHKMLSCLAKGLHTYFDLSAPRDARPTALHYAVLVGNEDAVAHLVSKGADPLCKVMVFPDIMKDGESSATPLSAFSLADLCLSRHMYRDVYKLREHRILHWKGLCQIKVRRITRLLESASTVRRHQPLDTSDPFADERLAYPMEHEEKMHVKNFNMLAKDGAAAGGKAAGGGESVVSGRG